MSEAKKRTKQSRRTRSGVVLDDATIDELVRQVEDESTEWGEALPPNEWPVRGRGRPSLTGDATHSPRVTFRLDPTIRDEATARAKREGKSVSALAREALEHYLAS
jgi:hypothetical protein